MMRVEDILKMSRAEFEGLPLDEFNLSLDRDIRKINLLTQWYNTYNRKTTSEAMKESIVDNVKRLLCIQ
jgi:hypothetical protein